MSHRTQQLGIDPGQPRQGLRIQSIILLPALPDLAHLRACATITWGPTSPSVRLAHGECIPVSRAIRLRGSLPNTSFIAFGVASFCSRSNCPAASKTQNQLQRSPRSNPIVSFCPEKFLLCAVKTALKLEMSISLLRRGAATQDRHLIGGHPGLLPPNCGYLNHVGPPYRRLRFAAKQLNTNGMLVKVRLKSSFIDRSRFLIHIHARRSAADVGSSQTG